MLISMYMLAGSGGKYTKNKENTPAIELKPVTEASIYYGGIMYGGKGMRKFLLRIGAFLAAAAVLATGSIALAGGVTTVAAGPGSSNVLGGTFFVVKLYGCTK